MPPCLNQLRSFAYYMVRADGGVNVRNARWRATLDLNFVLKMPQLTGERNRPGSLASLKEKLIKIGAKVVSHGRYVAFQKRRLPSQGVCSPTFCG